MSSLNERLSIVAAVVLAVVAFPCIDPMTLLDGARYGAIELAVPANSPAAVPAALARTLVQHPPRRSCAPTHGRAA
jgi:hypothetical protein